MQPLLDHLERMHDIKWLVRSFAMDSDNVLSIHFFVHNSLTFQPFPCSIIEGRLEIKIMELERRGFKVKYGLNESSDISVVNLEQKYHQTRSDQMCSDCKGTRVYQPFTGPEEPCQTCQS